jgi:hypothetical protein
VRATRIIWQGAGSHAPHEGDGTTIPPRDPATLAPVCAMCGESSPRWTNEDAFSDNFRPLSHLSKLFPHAVEGFPVSLCAACVWCSRALRLRCASFFARADGVWFVPRRHLLTALLDPPVPPFVACAPLYGADHGGEAHGWRALWPGEPALPEGVDVLTRLQAKHVAGYADVAHERDRYPLQWDDHTRVIVDVSLWRDLAARLDAIASALRGGGVGVTDCRESMVNLRAPARAPLAVHRDWSALVRGLDRYARAAWWPFLADIVPLPEAPPRPEKAPRPAPARPALIAPETPPPAPAAPPKAKAAQLTLF